jgi:hypothetical protein
VGGNAHHHTEDNADEDNVEQRERDANLSPHPSSPTIVVLLPHADSSHQASLKISAESLADRRRAWWTCWWTVWWWWWWWDGREEWKEGILECLETNTTLRLSRIYLCHTIPMLLHSQSYVQPGLPRRIARGRRQTPTKRKTRKGKN